MKYKSILFDVIFAVFMLSGCGNDNVASPDGEISEDFSTILEPKARWQAYDLKDYTIEQQTICFCAYNGVHKLIVENNEIVEIIKPDGEKFDLSQSHSFKTISELFEIIESVDPDSVASFEVTYDRRFGFPSSLAIDYSTAIADEEITWITGNLRKITK